MWQAFNFHSEASKFYFVCISELMVLLLKFIEPSSYNSSIESNLLHNVSFVRQINILKLNLIRMDEIKDTVR